MRLEIVACHGDADAIHHVGPVAQRHDERAEFDLVPVGVLGEILEQGAGVAALGDGLLHLTVVEERPPAGAVALAKGIDAVERFYWLTPP